jgi:hypothetical protein
MMVLSKGDDFPIHQTADPIAYSGTDRNFYDRYFFNGYAPDGSGFFALALGIYPHLDIADAHFNFIRGDTQYCLHASREMGMERMAMRVGPIAIEVVEPLNKLKITIDESHGIAGEFTFTGRSYPIEEPRFTHRIGPRAFMDYTRMTQNGHYGGWIELDGEREEMVPGTSGTRDRSWGVRPVGARDQQPMPGTPMPAFFWQWTPINLAERSLFFHINADAEGKPWNTKGVSVLDRANTDGQTTLSGELETRLQPGTRWPATSRLSLSGGRESEKLDLEPIGQFMMKGLGYTHPVWGHGLHHGPLKVEREDIDLNGLDPADPSNFHVQMICRISGAEQGIGIFEQLIIGPYAPLNLTGLFDTA